MTEQPLSRYKMGDTVQVSTHDGRHLDNYMIVSNSRTPAGRVAVWAVQQAQTLFLPDTLLAVPI